eukprot:6503594-Ditylum_brightwellii.AAC.1
MAKTQQRHEANVTRLALLLFDADDNTDTLSSLSSLLASNLLHFIITTISIYTVQQKYKVVQFEMLAFFISEKCQWYQQRNGQSMFAPYSLPSLPLDILSMQKEPVISSVEDMVLSPNPIELHLHYPRSESNKVTF